MLLKNVNIHGLAIRGMNVGRLTDWTLENVNIVGNGTYGGWDGDIDPGSPETLGSSNSGLLSFKNVNIQYNGCSESYPEKKILACFDNSHNGCNADGLGTGQTNGTWVFEDCDISHNTSDGLDLLYLSYNNSLTVNRCRFEGNTGNQLKVTGTATVDNSVLISNCDYMDDSGLYPFDGDSCRAGGNTVAISPSTGLSVNINNSTLWGEGDVMIDFGNLSNDPCDGTETITIRNSIIHGAEQFNDPGDRAAWYYCSGNTGNGGGDCCEGSFNTTPTVSNTIVYNVKNDVCPDGATCEDPKFNDPHQPILEGFAADAYDISLQDTSPAIDQADETIPTNNPNNDFYNCPRGASWDIGAIQYGEYSRCDKIIQPNIYGTFGQ